MMERMGMACLLALVVTSVFLVASAAEKPGQDIPVTVPVDKDGVQRVEILAGGYFFRPNHIIVKINVPVELRVRKESGVIPHNIALKAPEAGMEFNESLGSGPKTIKFTPSRTGRYPFYCDKKLLFFESHREKGMEGVMEVIE